MLNLVELKSLFNHFAMNLFLILIRNSKQTSQYRFTASNFPGGGVTPNPNTDRSMGIGQGFNPPK